MNHLPRRLSLSVRTIVLLAMAASIGMLSIAVAQTELPGNAANSAPYLHETDKIWLHAQQEVDTRVLDQLLQRENILKHEARARRIAHGDTRLREVALTFDDGPHRKFTPQLLAILKQYDIHATFFLVGMKAEQAPDLVRDEFNAGHNLGNHTFHHVNLTKMSDAVAATEIKACGEVLHAITGETPHLFRPPGGDYDPQIARFAAGLGYTLSLWTNDPGDYARPPKQVLMARLLRKTTNGCIILLHDGVQQTVDILPQFIETLQSRGYQFVTLDEMLAHRQAQQP
ncbi:MAG TPA: polysaccharide deacetylase family protein [Armatimonadota bacterium]|jgi:peptidoglycan/xylan/chitin deacetylase (PgdA/CDA1 family)